MKDNIIYLKFFCSTWDCWGREFKVVLITKNKIDLICLTCKRKFSIHPSYLAKTLNKRDLYLLKGGHHSYIVSEEEEEQFKDEL